MMQNLIKMVEQKLKVIYRNYGIADRFEDGTIELNRNLNDYPELKSALLKHEIKHTSNPNLNKHDFIHDLSSQERIRTWDLMRFMFRHPKSLIQFLPVYYTKERGIIKDKNLIVIYSFFLIIALIGIYFGVII